MAKRKLALVKVSRFPLTPIHIITSRNLPLLLIHTKPPLIVHTHIDTSFNYNFLLRLFWEVYYNTSSIQ